MPVYLYENKEKYYVSPVYIHNTGFENVKTYDFEIECLTYSNQPKKITAHTLNNSLSIPARYAFYLVLDRETKGVRIGERFRVLHDYSIRSDDLVFEIYYINKAIKIFYGYTFDPNNFYHICLSCGNVHRDIVQTCIDCSETYCESCNVSLSNICNDCDINLFMDDPDEITLEDD